MIYYYARFACLEMKKKIIFLYLHVSHVYIEPNRYDTLKLPDVTKNTYIYLFKVLSRINHYHTL